MLDKINEYEKMAIAEENHWWYQTLFKTTLLSIQKNFFTKNISILDAGCGTGGFIKYLQKFGYKNIFAFDINSFACEKANEKTGITIQCCSLADFDKLHCNQKYDVITCHDVLYFLDDKIIEETLEKFYTHLNSNGIVIINLPALKIFKGSHDKVVGIKKRYSKKDFLKFIPSNYKITHFAYRHFLISPLIIFKRCYSRIVPSLESDVTVKNGIVNKILISVNKPILGLQKISPFGSSIYIVLKRN